MRKKTVLIVAFALAVLLMGICFWINFAFDDIRVIPQSQFFKDLKGNISQFDLPVYAEHYKGFKFLSELCFTLGTAIIVFLVVDQALSAHDKKQEKKERDDNFKKFEDLQLQINRNVFEGVLKMLIPQTLFEILASDVLNRNIIRQNVIWEYTIKENDQGGYTLTQLIVSEFLNISNLTSSVTINNIGFHNSVNKCYFDYYKSEKKDGTIIQEQNREEIEKDSEITDIKTGRSEVIELQGKQTVKVTHKIVCEYSSKHIIDTHWSKYSIVGLAIRVNKPADCRFEIFPTFSEKLQIDRQDSNTITYKHVKGLLIGQSVSFIIEPMQKNVANAINDSKSAMITSVVGEESLSQAGKETGAEVTTPAN